MHVVRRPRLLGVALAAFALFPLAACGGDDGETAKESAPRVAEGCADAPEDVAEDGTRTVADTFLGDVEGVPTNPKRIVALWRVGSELADLCVVPVGQLDAELVEEEIDPAIWPSYADVPTVGNYDGLDVEKLIELDPDLVIGMDHGGLGLKYDEIAELFPTVILPIEEPTDVWDNYPKIAELVGRSTDYATKTAAVDAQLAEIAEEHGEVIGDLEVTSLNVADQLYADTSKALTYRRLVAAGFGYNETYTDDPERYVEPLATENLADLSDQDVLFFEADAEGEPMPEIRDILDSASFKRLPAVKAGNVFPLASGTVYTFAAAQAQVDDLRAAAEGYRAP